MSNSRTESPATAPFAENSASIKSDCLQSIGSSGNFPRDLALYMRNPRQILFSLFLSFFVGKLQFPQSSVSSIFQFFNFYPKILMNSSNYIEGFVLIILKKNF